MSWFTYRPIKTSISRLFSKWCAFTKCCLRNLYCFPQSRQSIFEKSNARNGQAFIGAWAHTWVQISWYDGTQVPGMVTHWCHIALQWTGVNTTRPQWATVGQIKAENDPKHPSHPSSRKTPSNNAEKVYIIIENQHFGFIFTGSIFKILPKGRFSTVSTSRARKTAKNARKPHQKALAR